MKKILFILFLLNSRNMNAQFAEARDILQRLVARDAAIEPSDYLVLRAALRSDSLQYHGETAYSSGLVPHNTGGYSFDVSTRITLRRFQPDTPQANDFDRISLEPTVLLMRQNDVLEVFSQANYTRFWLLDAANNKVASADFFRHKTSSQGKITINLPKGLYRVFVSKSDSPDGILIGKICIVW